MSNNHFITNLLNIKDKNLNFSEGIYHKVIKGVTYTVLTAKEEGWEKTGEYEYLICEIVAYIPQKKQDTDNMFKCLLDAIKDSNVCYDDSMIIPRVKDVFIDSSNPRVEVDLHKSCKQGIFKNATIKKSFIESNCKNCSRMSRNCSLLKKSLENRIQPEISIKNNLCTSYKEKRS